MLGTRADNSLMERKTSLPVYWFGWPSHLGGADTKLTHTLWLLHRDYDMTVVPNARAQLEQTEWREWLHGLGIKTALLEELPAKLEGWGVSLCNGEFWAGGVGLRARARGLKIAWSNEMMWHHPGEIAAASIGAMDKVLYTSEVQRKALEKGYAGEVGPVGRASSRAGEVSGGSRVRSPHRGICGRYPNGLHWVITGNYIAPELFPWKDRTKERRFAEFVIGRLSRPDPGKYPTDFPESYRRLGLRNARYRVMAWSEQLREIYGAPVGTRSTASETSPKEMGTEWNRSLPAKGSRFIGTWDLLEARVEPTVDFLQSLDLFVYDLREDCSESWGRAVVEAMLTGAVPLVPGHPRHHLKHLVPQGVGGFLCSTKAEWCEHAQRLQKDATLRQKMSKAAREFAVEELCNARKHRAAWREVFEG